MKVRKNYVLFINPMLGVAYYGNSKFGRRVNNVTIGKVYDCTFSELKNNIKLLLKRNYSIFKRNY